MGYEEQQYDLNQVPDFVPFTTVPKGVYALRCVEAVAEDSSAGNPMVTVTWKIEFDEQQNEIHGAQVRDWIVFNERGISKLKAIYLASQYKLGTVGTSLASREAVANELVGAECWAVIEPKPENKEKAPDPNNLRIFNTVVQYGVEQASAPQRAPQQQAQRQAPPPQQQNGGRRPPLPGR